MLRRCTDLHHIIFRSPRVAVAEPCRRTAGYSGRVAMGGVAMTVIALFAMLGLLVAIEHVRPVRAFENVPGWRRKCVAFMPMVIGIAAATPYAMPKLVQAVKLLPGERLCIVGGTLLGVVVSELIVYWSHR